MENENNGIPTIYNINSIVAKLEELTGQKVVKDTILNTDYMFGNIDENVLVNMGFEFVSMSNNSGFKTPIYKLGNIEAVFVDQILHIFEVGE